MKFRFKIFILLPLLLLLNRNIKADNCIPSGTIVTLTRQSEVDSFPINYPGCDVVEGTLNISGNDIVNLIGLNNLKRIYYLNISANPLLINLNGLESLTYVEILELRYNEILFNFSGLNNLDSTNSIVVIENDKLVNFYGLGNLKFTEFFEVWNNDSLVNFIGLNSLNKINSEFKVSENKSLIDWNGLSNVSYIYKFHVFRNPLIQDFKEFRSLNFLGGFNIIDNNSLLNFNGFDNVLKIYEPSVIENNRVLVNFNGLNNIDKFYSVLTVSSNMSIQNFSELNKVKFISQFRCYANESLINFSGLENLDSLPYGLYVSGNPRLINFEGLQNLKSIIISNSSSTFQIVNNNSLCSINQLNKNLIINGSYLNIFNNPILSCCNIMDTILRNNPSLTDIRIYNNATGCNDTTEIRTFTTQNCCSTKYTFLKDTICQGESIVFDGQTLTTNGTYYDTIIVGSIDSIIVFQLTVRNKSYQIQNKNLCIGQSFTLSNGRIITTNGTYNDTIPNICDSIIEYRLSFLNNITTNQNASVCKGKTYTLPKGNTVSVAGIYKDTLQASFGCDSIIITNLTITNPTPFNNNVTICSGKTFTRPNGIMVSTTGIYYDTIKAPNTCDSVIITNLTVTPYLQSAQTISVCSGKSFVLPGGRSVNQSGIYKDTIRNNFGCDSIITTNLTVTNPIPFMNTAVICEGQAYTLPDGNSVTTAGTYTDTIKQTNTCDSVVITNLSVLPNNFIVSLNATDTIESGSAIQLQPVYSGGTALSWSWAPSNYLSCTTCEQAVATPLQTTQYIVKVKSTDGCEDTAQAKIVVRQTEIYIPQAFSPNNDGVNDKVVVFASNPAAFSIKIYNRWSELLFESNTINDTWNGTYKGEDCMQDTYTYILDVTMQNGKQYHKQGTILLLR